LLKAGRSSDLENVELQHMHIFSYELHDSSAFSPEAERNRGIAV